MKGCVSACTLKGLRRQEPGASGQQHKRPLVQSLLLIEDCPELRDLVGVCLDTWTIREASNRIQALGLLDDSKPDLILLDSQLDDGPSPLWFSQLRGAFDGPIVWFSSKAPGPELTGQIAGHILKPFDPMQLANQLEQLLRAAGRNRTDQNL